MRGFPFCDLLQGPRLAGTQNGVPDVGVGEWSFLCKRKGVVYGKGSTMIELIKQRRTNRRGFALMFATVMVLILSIVGFGMLRLGLETRMMASRTTAEISARAAADAGLTKAVFEMNKNLVNWNFNDIVSSTGTVFSSANANYNYTIEEIARDAEYRITSIGQSGHASKTVSMTVVVQGAFDYAIFAQGYTIPRQPKPPKQNPPAPKPLKKGGKLEIKGYSVDDSYSSDPSEAYSGTIQLRTNNRNKRSVKLRENVVVNGDVIMGPGGVPVIVIEMKSGASITGDAYPAIERQELLSVSLPQSLENMTTQTYEYTGAPIAGNKKYFSLIIPKDVGAVQNIVGNCEIYVVGNVKIEDGAQLIVTNNASLTLYVGGEKFEVKKKSAGLINETKDPTNLLIFGLDDCRKVKIENENTDDFYGAVYAPFAKVEMKTNGDLYGAFVGWDVKLKKKKGGANGTFYFDRSLRIDNLLATDDLATRFVVKRWQE